MARTSKKSQADPSLKMAGEMNIYRAGELQHTLLQALAKSAVLDIDLSAVTEFDTAGLQLLLTAKKSAVAAHGALHLVHPSPVVTKALQLLHLDAQLEPVGELPASKES